MSIKSFLQEIEKGLKAPSYLLYAKDPYLLEEAVSAVKKTLSEEDLSLNLNIYDLDSPDTTPSVEDIIISLKTVSFWGKRRYVFIKNLQEMSKKDLEKIKAYLDSPSPDALLIMLSKKKNETLKGPKAFSLDVREQDLPLFVKEKAKEKNIKIDDKTIDYLIGVVGPDIGLLSSEIEKLSTVGSETITTAIIKEVVEGSREYSIFDLTNALKYKNAEKVFRIYKALSESTEPYGLLGAINWQYTQLMKSETKDSRRLYYRKAFELLNEADIQIKTSGAYPMEYLLVRLLQL